MVKLILPLVLSCAAIICGVIVARRNSSNLQKMSLAMTVSISLAVSCLSFLYFEKTSRNLLFAVLSTLRYGTQTITLNLNPDIAYAAGIPGSLTPVYSFLLSALYILGPIFASMFILGFSRTLLELIRFSRYKHVHVFSQLNERSIVTAESLYRRQNDSMRVFCCSDTAPEELRARARSAHCLLVRYPENELRLLKGRNYHFYEINDDYNAGLHKTNELISRLAEKKQYTATVRSFITHDQLEAVRLFDSKLSDTAPNVKIRYIDEMQMQAAELFCNVIRNSSLFRRNRHYTILIVGAGECGLSILRTAGWLFVLPECTCTIHVVDAGARNIAAKLKEEAPEFLNAPIQDYFTDNKKNKNYDIIFHEIDAEDASFSAFLRTIRTPDLSVVCLADDYLSHRTAALICRTFALSSETLEMPEVAVRIRSAEAAGLFQGDMPLMFFGSIEKQYDYQNLIHPELEEAAKVVHQSYYGSDTWTPEIERAFYRYVNYDSSFAQALAMLGRREYLLASKPDGTEPDAWISHIVSDQAELARLGEAEHDRWNAYQRINGWQCVSLEQAELIARKTNGRRVKDDILLLHPAIVPYSELAQREADIDAIRRRYNPDASGVNYVQSDRQIISCILNILEKADA